MEVPKLTSSEVLTEILGMAGVRTEIGAYPEAFFNRRILAVDVKHSMLSTVWITNPDQLNFLTDELNVGALSIIDATVYHKEG
jgi:hypothetical protein